MLAARATSVSQGSYSREIFSNVKQGRGLFTALSQSQLVKTYRYSMREALCMCWGGCRGRKGRTYETQSLHSRHLWVMIGSVIFSRRSCKVMLGTTPRQDSSYCWYYCTKSEVSIYWTSGLQKIFKHLLSTRSIFHVFTETHSWMHEQKYSPSFYFCGLNAH